MHLGPSVYYKINNFVIRLKKQTCIHDEED